MPCVYRDDSEEVIGAAVYNPNIRDADTISKPMIIVGGVLGCLSLTALVIYDIKRRRLNSLEQAGHTEKAPQNWAGVGLDPVVFNSLDPVVFNKHSCLDPVVFNKHSSTFSLTPSQKSFNTQNIQKTGTFNSCCDPC